LSAGSNAEGRRQVLEDEPHRHNEEYYRLLFVANPLPMWVFEVASGRFLAVNAEACRHYGYSESEFLGMTIAQIRAPADVAQLEAIRSLQPAGHRALGVWRHRKENGQVIDVEITSDDIVFEGKPSRLVVAKDVTELVRTTRALREREERFHYVAKATDDAVWDWNLRDDALWWNSGIERLFGLPAMKVATIGAWRALIHPEDRERVVGSVRVALDSDAEQWTCDYRVLRSDDSYAFVYDRGFVIRDPDGAAVRMVGAMTDLSERRAHEERLREQAMLLDKARDAIVVRDSDNRIRYWNHAAERLYGVSRDQALGRDIGAIVVAEDEEAFRAADRHVQATGEWSGPIRQVLGDGRTITVDGHWTLLRDDSGQPSGVLKINTDVSARVDLEQRLAQSQKLESIGQLTGGIAHDFNNLLTVIIGNSAMLVEELSSDPRLVALATMVQTAGERGAELIDRLLAFARQQALQPENVRPDKLIDGMRELLKVSLGENIDLTVTHANALSRVSIDPGQFEAALLNLCINARDAMAAGGRLMIETSDVILDRAYADQRADVQPGLYVRIAITDTGAGMPSDVAARAFDPFFTTKEKGRGTGLGLSMVYV
jgi:PAS domain S-box-containing protein